MSKISTGSSVYDEPVFLVIGRLGKPHGLRGDVVFYVMTDFPERIRPGKKVYIGEEYEPHVISFVKSQPDKLVIRMKGYGSREDLVGLPNQYVYVHAEEIPQLEDGEIYHHQMLGMKVVKEDGTFLGTLIQILETGANDVYIVGTPDDKEVLLPAIDEVILGIDTEKNEIRIRLLPGLVE